MSDTFLPFCKPPIDEDDINAVVSVLRSGWITTGSQNAALENAFCDKFGAKHAVAMTSATAAMHVYLHALGIRPGDEVISPSLTWVSAVNIISLLGATPVFVDVNKDTLMVEAEAIERAITPRTRLIIPVHFAGATLNLDPIRQVARRHGIPVLEDAAHALGSEYKGTPIGQQGDAVFSLQAIKNITTAEGGVFVTEDGSLAQKLRQLKFHGLGVDAFDRNQQGRSPQAEVVAPGFKYNLPDMCAALAVSQLKRLRDINQKRTDIASFYLNAFKNIAGISPLQIPEWDQVHSWHLFVVRINEQAPLDRDTFITSMKEKNIGCGLHFRAIHQQKFYRDFFSATKFSLPHTEWNSERICSLPLFPGMSLADAERVVSTVVDVFREH